MGNEIGSGITGLLLGLLFGMFSTGIAGAWFTNDSWEKEIVNRGLALYCPNNGEWAWKGECK